MSELKKDIKNLLLHVGYYKKLNEQVIEPTGDDDNVGGSNWDNPDTLIDYGNVWGDDIVLPGDGSNDDDYIYIPNITPDENYIDDEFDYDFNVNNPNLTYNPDSFQFYDMKCDDYGCMDSNAYNFNANAGPWAWCGTYCHYDAPISFYDQDYNDESYACTIMSQETGGNFYACYVLDGFTYNPGGANNSINNYQVQCCQVGNQICTASFGCTGDIDPQQISSVIDNMTTNESCTPENRGCRDPQYANFSPDHECDCAGNYLGQWVMGGFKGDTFCCNNDRCNNGLGPIWSESPACKDGNTTGGGGPVDDSGMFINSGCKDPEAINFNPNNNFLNHDPKDCEYRGENPYGNLETGWDTDTPDNVDIIDNKDEDEQDEFNVTIDRVTPDWENPKDKKSKSKPSSPVISGETKTNKIKKDVKVKPTKEKLNEAKKCKIGKKCGGPDCHGCTWTWMFNKCTCSYGGMTPAGTNDWEKSISNDTPNIVKDKLREEFTRMKTIWKYRI